jgi:hypothetical protein
MSQRVTYNATVRDETAEMQPAVAALDGLKGVLDAGDLGEVASLNLLVDANNVLPDDATGANVQVADLRVSHEALGKADGVGGGLELGELGLVLGKGVHRGSLGGSDGIAILGRIRGGNAPAIDND